MNKAIVEKEEHNHESDEEQKLECIDKSMKV